MAKAAWIKMDVTSGTGNKTIKVSTDPYKGRLGRSTTATIANQTGSKPSKVLTVNQTPTPLYLTRVSGPTPQTMGVNDPYVTLVYKTNGAHIKACEYSSDLIDGTLCKLKVGEVTQTLNADDSAIPNWVPSGDPGASNEYTFTIEIHGFTNPDAFSRDLEYSVSVYAKADGSDNGVSDDFNVMQSGAISSLSVAPETITIPAIGTAQEIKITSNDRWVIS